MPIYEYECEKCGVTFEAMQNISAKPLKTCQGLGCNDKDNGKVHRIMSQSGFILKGSGWYASDYPSEDRKKGWEKESGQSKGGTDATPAPAADTKAPAAEKKAAPAPTPAKKPTQKNPYSSGKSKKAKGPK
ncbi:MAG: zinc ribbon domain-containing protein [Nitrospinota bacterium]